MQLTPNITPIDERPPNTTALSLVLFLLVSMLSMMAVYDPGRPSDDIRNSVVITLHEYSSPSSDSNADGDPLVVALASASFWFEAPRVRPSTPKSLSILSAASAFDARGPPVSGALAS